jgi:hypothetical protein
MGARGFEIKEIRESYPNYDRPWSKADDALLRDRIKQGHRPCEIARELSKKLGRSSTAVAVRVSILRVCEC